MNTRLPNSLGQYRCSHCAKWKDPDKFGKTLYGCGVASWCKMCLNRSYKRNRRKGGTLRPIKGDVFVPIVKQSERSGQRAGTRLYDENLNPFVCDKTGGNIVYAIDGTILTARNKEIPCTRMFDRDMYRFEVFGKI